MSGPVDPAGREGGPEVNAAGTDPALNAMRVMPNWCTCEVKFSGRPERVRELLAFAKGDSGTTRVFDFNRFIPYPREWRELDAAFLGWLARNPDRSDPPPVHAYDRWGYTWCCDNWGTNSNALGAYCGDTLEHISYLRAVVRFETAWREPWPVILKASELFPDLSFELHYFEPLGDFAGCYLCAAGVGSDAWWPCDQVEVNRMPEIPSRAHRSGEQDRTGVRPRRAK